MSYASTSRRRNRRPSKTSERQRVHEGAGADLGSNVPAGELLAKQAVSLLLVLGTRLAYLALELPVSRFKLL